MIKTLKMNKFFSLFLFLILFSCNPQSDGNKSTGFELTNDKETLMMGKELSALTFKKMSTVLKGKMQMGGVHEATSFCNKNAYPLVDSISKANGALIKRVSLKYRNASNQPDSLETLVIQHYQHAIDNKQALSPLVYSNGVVNRYFSPIKTKNLCLSCHGTPGETMTETDYEFILNKYPGDKAINYNEDELRGIWSIAFNQ